MAGFFGPRTSDSFSDCRNFAVIFGVNCQNPVRLAKIPARQDYPFGSKIHTLSIWYLVFCIKSTKICHKFRNVLSEDFEGELELKNYLFVGFKKKGFLFF